MMIDYQSIYKKDHKENLRIFGDLKEEKEFSSYAYELDRAFGDNSYNQFYRNLTEPKKFVGNNYLSLFQKQDNLKTKVRSNLFEEQFNLKQFEESLANMKLKDKILNEKIKFPYIERMKDSPSYILRKEIEKHNAYKQNKSLKSFFPQVPDVGRYNPYYNSINKHSYRAFFGNVPTNRFYTIDQEINRKNKNRLDNLDKDENDEKKEPEENSIKKVISNNNLFNRQNDNRIKKHFSIRKIMENNKNIINDNPINNNENNIKIIKENKSEKTFNFKNSNNISLITDNNSINNSFINNSPSKDKSNNSKNNSSIEGDKNSSLNKSIKSKSIKDNNHCLRFETYTSRKPLNKTIIYNTDIRTELPNYYTSKYIKNNINFNKISNTPNYIEQAISRDQNPPLGFYQPKYNYVFNNIDKNIYIYKKNVSHFPRNHLKKIFCEYNVSQDYQTVPSLNKNYFENNIVNTEINNKKKI